MSISSNLILYHNFNYCIILNQIIFRLVLIRYLSDARRCYLKIPAHTGPGLPPRVSSGCTITIKWLNNRKKALHGSIILSSCKNTKHDVRRWGKRCDPSWYLSPEDQELNDAVEKAKQPSSKSQVSGERYMWVQFIVISLDSSIHHSPLVLLGNYVYVLYVSYTYMLCTCCPLCILAVFL